MLRRLKWRPLANRRKDARLMMMYKIDRELHVVSSNMKKIIKHYPMTDRLIVRQEYMLGLPGG
jgi:hypothetical protein